MPLPFRQQIDLFNALVNAPHLTICVGSGVSRGCLPLLNALIARAFNNTPLTDQARAAFLGYSEVHGFHDRLATRGIITANPCTLDEFRAIPAVEQARLCVPLIGTYGEVFSSLAILAGDKRALLDSIGFHEFGTVDADVAHFYIGFLILEGVVRRLLTTNWDRLIEAAVENSTSRPLNAVLDVIRDAATWLDRNQGAYVSITKVHGCFTQYPDHCENIILTAAELQLATGPSWSRDAVNEFINGTVLFSGYSASDYTVMVPIKVLSQLRALNLLDCSRFYIAQESDLNAAGLELIHNEPARHIRLWANDTFTSLYFAYLRQRLGNAISTAEQQRRPERAFSNWEEDDWQALITRLRALTNEDLGAFLDNVIGAPNHRLYDATASQLPIRLSAIRELFLVGRLVDREKYQNLQFDTTKDIVLLVLLAVLVDLSRSTGGPRFSLETAYSGITIIEDSGSRRKMILLYGTYINTAYPSLLSYLSDVEDADGHLPEFEVAVIPCSRYDVPDDAYPVRGLLAKTLPGGKRARRRFVHPVTIFATTSYDNLVGTLRAELEL
jgi:hypothetical protein